MLEEPWKMQQAERHFLSEGLSAMFVYGFYGPVVGLRPTNPFEDDQQGIGRYIHATQVGCNLSHMTALRTALTMEWDEFIICEDDVKFLPDFVDRWTKLRKDLPEDAEVVQLEYDFGGDGKGGRYNPVEHGEIHPVTGTLARTDKYPYCTACIWWTRKAARRAIELLKPVDKTYDSALITKVYPFLSHYLAWPFLASQKSRTNEWASSIGDAPKAKREQEN
jgi:GR25 family glycosyltransferase involved in LPS biosynthesis